MNKILFSVLVVLALAVGGLYFKKPVTVVKQVLPNGQEQLVGASSGTEHYNEEHFYNGLTSRSVETIGALSTSSSTPAAYGSASSFQIVVPAAATVGRASTTAVTSTSNRVFITQRADTGLAGVTCNTAAIATGTRVSLNASTTDTSLNGVVITVPAVPATNPYCFDVFVVK